LGVGRVSVIDPIDSQSLPPSSVQIVELFDLYVASGSHRSYTEPSALAGGFWPEAVFGRKEFNDVPDSRPNRTKPIDEKFAFCEIRRSITNTPYYILTAMLEA